LPPRTSAVFGNGPIAHHQDDRWVLEALTATTLQLRRTGAGGFYNFSFHYPTDCNGESRIVESRRFTLSVGDTLQGTFCNEGSMMLVTVEDSAGFVKPFRCYRRTGNQNICQRLF